MTDEGEGENGSCAAKHGQIDNAHLSEEVNKASCNKSENSAYCRAGHHVTLFEKEGFCGGHSITDESPGFPVDLGFQVRLKWTLMLPISLMTSCIEEDKLSAQYWPNMY